MIFIWGGCKFVKSGSLPDFLNVGILQKFWSFLPQRVQIWQKRTFPWILSHFFVQKYIKFPIFQTSFARKQQFGGLFCRLGNLGGAMHPCTPPVTGMPSTCIGDYRIVHVQQTLNYTNLTTAPKCKKPNLNLCMCAGVGVWVLLKSPFCVKHQIFTNISWDFDDLSTKTRHAPYNVWSSKHPPAGCTLDGNVIVTDQKDTLLLRVASSSPPFESALPPPLGITEVPGVLFSPSS